MLGVKCVSQNKKAAMQGPTWRQKIWCCKCTNYIQTNYLQYEVL